MIKLTADAKYEDSDIKAAVAALSFIFSSAVKHSVSGDALDNELQQLGLPKGIYITHTHTHTHMPLISSITQRMQGHCVKCMVIIFTS